MSNLFRLQQYLSKASFSSASDRQSVLQCLTELIEQENGTSLSLTQRERNRFASWLEHEAATSKGLIEQMEKLPQFQLVIIEREKAEAAAATLIATKLRAIHCMDM